MSEQGKVVTAVESLLLKLDEGVFSALSRLAVGFLILPVTRLVLGGEEPRWTLLAALLIALFLLRLVPAAVRKLIPVSDTVRSEWRTRRQLAKRYDCYQWRKLFWIGLGVTLSGVVTRQLSLDLIFVCAISLVGGAIGIVRWNRLVRSGVVTSKSS